MINIDLVKLPNFMHGFIKPRVEFATQCRATLSGRELRQRTREEARLVLELENCVLSKREFQEFSNFFYARRGAANGFLYSNPLDFVAFEEIIFPNGVNAEFDITKTYKDEANPYKKHLNAIREDSFKMFMFEGGEFIIGSREFSEFAEKMYDEPENFDAKVNYLQGTLKFNEPPMEGYLICMKFEFDYLVRFAHDSFSYNCTKDDALMLDCVRLQEIKI